MQRFFDDRQCISSTTRAFLERDQKFRDLLSKSSLWDKLHHGTHLFGLSTVEEHFALDLVVRTLRPKKIVEIGVFRGQTALTMSRALSQTGSQDEVSFTGIDIDKIAVGIAEEVLGSHGLSFARFIVGDSNQILPTLPVPDFVFIDGDHGFEAVAKDFVSAYNNVGAGAVIAMHDIGSKVWGYHQGPGWLFYQVLPALLGNGVLQSRLDSMCRETTMRLLSPVNDSLYKYCASHAEALELARLTSVDTIDGAGGLGFILKLDGTHSLDLSEVLAKAPALPEAAPEQRQHRTSLLGRAARKIANWIP
jgi:cephalosporin hydroxylase